MKIVSMGEGLFDDVVQDMHGKVCILLECDSHEEMSNALRDFGFRDAVTVVRRPDVQGEGQNK